MITTKDWIEKAKAIHGEKFDYSKTVYTRSIDKLTIGCPIHGDIIEEARWHLKGMGCTKCGRKYRNRIITTHGKSLTSEYGIWRSMNNRCYLKTSKAYSGYGARGITVCKTWRNSFENFIADMGYKPEGMSLDRIDNNKGYSPENCRWATIIQQQNNRGDFNYRIEYAGISLTSAEWARIIEVDRHKPANWNKTGILEKKFKQYNIENILKNMQYI